MEFLKGETAGKRGRGYSKLSPVCDLDDLICLLSLLQEFMSYTMCFTSTLSDKGRALAKKKYSCFIKYSDGLIKKVI